MVRLGANDELCILKRCDMCHEMYIIFLEFTLLFSPLKYVRIV